MGVQELIDALWGMREHEANRIYNEATLIGWAIGGKGYPRTARDALPGMFAPRKRYAMPAALKKVVIEETKNGPGDRN